MYATIYCITNSSHRITLVFLTTLVLDYLESQWISNDFKFLFKKKRESSLYTHYIYHIRILRTQLISKWICKTIFESINYICY